MIETCYKNKDRYLLKHISPIEDIINEAKSGRMYILVDDECRENEGDVVIPAQFVDNNSINFMITNCRGLVCVCLTEARVKKLGLKLQRRINNEAYGTAFTESIEARKGVTTGISVMDRVRTIKVAIDDNCDINNIITPGHIFPLIAKPNGVLERNGHTEASVDISKLAGLNNSAVICEILNPDGSMSRLEQIVDFSKKYNLKIGSIADLVYYRNDNK